MGYHSSQDTRDETALSDVGENIRLSISHGLSRGAMGPSPGGGDPDGGGGGSGGGGGGVPPPRGLQSASAKSSAWNAGATGGLCNLKPPEPVSKRLVSALHTKTRGNTRG
jgi:hypothetical protein